MYIKQVVLSDFKSYGLRTVVDPFSPKINVVVGANGSGKSNFFHAICFVLSDVRGTLRPADRQKLLHEGAGETQLEAWVELLFDNSDGRFPSDKSEVRLRRTIGQKKDEFRLDNKTVTKSEVQDLLEAAGFSRSNPYNIVQQGKIAQMSLMKDSERLELLKEIAGTKVYEDRRRESLRELMQMDGKRAVISEQINCLEQRMAELEEERQELAAFQEQDRERRAIEFAIYDRELADTKKRLEEVDRKQSKVRERTGSGQQQMEELRAQLEAAEARAKAAQQSTQGLEREKLLAQDRHAADLQAAMQAEGDLRDLQTLLQTNAAAKEDVETEIKALAAQVQIKQAEQEGVGKQLAAAEERQSKLEQSIAEREQKIQALYRKEGRSSRFKSAAERDHWVQEEILQLRVARGKKDAAAERLRGDMRELKDRIDELSLQITQMEAKGRQAQQEAAGGDRKRAELRLQRDKLQNERQQLFREEADLQRAIGDADEDLKAVQRQLESSTPRDVNVARRAIRGMVEKQKLEGVRGTLMELFDCREMLYTAVEVIAGGQLMNVVVDTQDVALQLHRELHRSKSGRVTFMPLDTIQAEIRDDYPKQWGQDVVPLIQFLEYPADLGHIMRKVFGRALVCRNMEVACQAAASQSEFDCVTLDGDQIERRGAMSGGYTEARMLKLPNCKRIKTLVESKLEKEHRLAAAQERLQELDGKLLRLQEQIEQQGGNASRVQEATAQHKVQTSLLQVEMQTARTARTAKEALLKKVENATSDLDRQVESLQAEVGTPLLANLSASERAQLDNLGQTLEELRQEHLQAKAAGLEVQAQHQQLESLLSGNMRKRLQELEGTLEELGQQEGQASLAEHSTALQAAKQRQEESEARLQKLEEDLEASTLQVAEHSRQQDKLREEILQLERTVQEQESAQENGLRQRAVLLQRRDDLSRKIRDLGSLPADALSSFRKKPSQDLKAALHRCNQELKKYSHVNKKALDQWTEFRDSHAAVCNRNAELNQADKRIRELIDMLDMRKDEQIERTFKQVAKAFKEIFARLVRGGWGELVMLKRVAGATETPEDDAEKGPNDVLEKYAGVKVKVSFGGGEAMTLKQLSGGQKTLVALVLIFAIQRCDPAPFYLFDEIDAALDPQYCVSVASMLKAQADNETSPQQFIVTTFRHQLVEAGDKVYGVSHSNRTSTIDVISRATATEFLQLEADRERQLTEHEEP